MNRIIQDSQAYSQIAFLINVINQKKNYSFVVLNGLSVSDFPKTTITDE